MHIVVGERMRICKMRDLHSEFFKKIGEVNLERMLLEIESIDCSKQLLLQGTHQNQDPTELVSKLSSGSINAWERKQDNVFTTAEVIHPLFNLPYINSIMNEYVLRYTRLMVLRPKTCYTYHIDKSKRVHIPLITNKENFFVVSDTVFRLPADGNVYEVDTTNIHTFVNGSMENRIHLVGLRV